MLSYKRKLELNLLRSKNRIHNIKDILPAADDYYFAGSGRGVMEGIIDALGLTPSDKLLIPAMVPEGLISPLRRKKIRTGCYKSSAHMSVDLEDLENCLKNGDNIKGVVIIHFFGYPQDTPAILKICRKYDVLLLEDCAQALGSKDRDGNVLGTLGDVAFYSLPKSIPVPDGALAIFNHGLQHKPLKYRRSPFHWPAVACHLMFLYLKKWELKMTPSLLYKLVNNGSKLLYAGYYQCLRWTAKPTRITRTSLHIASAFDHRRYLEQRRANAQYFYKHIDQNKYRLSQPDYHPSYILTGIPITSKNRDLITSALKNNGIETLSYVKRWFLLHHHNNDKNENGTNNRSEPINENNANSSPELLRERKNANETTFYHSHYLVPVSENITNSQMQFLVETMNRLSF